MPKMPEQQHDDSTVGVATICRARSDGVHQSVFHQAKRCSSAPGQRHLQRACRTQVWITSVAAMATARASRGRTPQAHCSATSTTRLHSDEAERFGQQDVEHHAAQDHARRPRRRRGEARPSLEQRARAGALRSPCQASTGRMTSDRPAAISRGTAAGPNCWPAAGGKPWMCQSTASGQQQQDAADQAVVDAHRCVRSLGDADGLHRRGETRRPSRP